MDDKTAAAIYGLYTAGVYLAALPGGWIADRLIGARRAVLVGGILDHLGQCIARGIVDTARLLSRPRGDRARRRAPEAERERDGRRALPRRRRAPGRRLHGVLHGHQSRRDARAPSSPARHSTLIGPRAGFGVAALFMAVGVLQYSLHAAPSRHGRSVRACRAGARAHLSPQTLAVSVDRAWPYRPRPRGVQLRLASGGSPRPWPTRARS